MMRYDLIGTFPGLWGKKAQDGVFAKRGLPLWDVGTDLWNASLLAMSADSMPEFN